MVQPAAQIKVEAAATGDILQADGIGTCVAIFQNQVHTPIVVEDVAVIAQAAHQSIIPAHAVEDVVPVIPLDAVDHAVAGQAVIEGRTGQVLDVRQPPVPLATPLVKLTVTLLS